MPQAFCSLLWVERLPYSLGSMASVSEMLRWRLPPILIAIVLILQFLRAGQPRRLLDFAEIFAGQAEVSKALRRAPRLFRPEPCEHEGGKHGVSLDYDYDRTTQDLLLPAGYLQLG